MAAVVGAVALVSGAVGTAAAAPTASGSTVTAASATTAMHSAKADKAFTVASSATSPISISLKVTQSSALGFTIQSTVTDSTAGATISNNTADDGAPSTSTIAWSNIDGNVWSGSFKYSQTGTYTVTDTVTDSAGGSATVSEAVTTLGSTLTPLTPTRLLDTRNGTGAPQAKVPNGGVVKLAIAGNGQIPVTGVVAVVLNVTVVDATSYGHITVYPTDDTSVPNASNVNYIAGQTVATLVTVAVGSDGYIDLANNAGGGSVDLIGDVTGYFTHTAQSLYEPVYPTQSRVLDTRNGTGAVAAKISAGGMVRLLVAKGNTYLAPPGDMTAVAVNITVTDTTGIGYVTAYADDKSTPNTSNLNFVKGLTVANMAVVPVAANGYIDLYVGGPAGVSVDLIADVAGYYGPSPNWASAAFVPVPPTRVYDSRTGDGPIPSGATRTLDFGVGGESVVTLLFNATVTDTTSYGALTAYPYGLSQAPTESNLNWLAGHTVPNQVYLMPNEANGWGDFLNSSPGSTDLIIDMFGYFQ